MNYKGVIIKQEVKPIITEGQLKPVPTLVFRYNGSLPYTSLEEVTKSIDRVINKLQDLKIMDEKIFLQVMNQPTTVIPKQNNAVSKF